MNRCPICNRKTDVLKTAIKDGQYISERCERCIANFNTSAIYARRNEREWQKRHYAKDTIQRFNGNDINPNFVDAYREESIKQWGPDVVRDYGIKKKLL